MSPMRWCYLILAVLGLLVQDCSAKYVRGAAHMFQRHNNAFLARFGFARGTGRLEVKSYDLSTEKPVTAPVHIRLILDEEWDKYQKTSSCEEKAAIARSWTNLAENSNGNNQVSVSQHIRPHIWYAVMDYCGVGPDETVMVSYQLTFINSGETHFGVEDYGMLKAHGVTLVLCVGLGMMMIYGALDLKKNAGGIHPAMGMCGIACLFHFLSVLFELLHLISYSNNGKGIYLLDIGSEVCMQICQVVTYALLLGVAWGWTLTSTKAKMATIPVDGGSIGFIASLLGLIQFTFCVIGRIWDDSHWKHHDHETWPGVLLVLLRVALMFFFIKGVNNTKHGEGIVDNEQKKSWLTRFMVAGVLWFMVLPIAVAIATICAPYIRHRVVSITTLILNTISLAVIGSQFVSRSEYFKLSLLSKNLLPGGKTI